MLDHHHPLLIVLLAAALAPLFNELPIRLRMPLVVLELLLGIVIGPQMLDLVGGENSVRMLSALGLCFLFFLAGMDLDFSTLRGVPLRLGALGWILSIVLALALAHALSSAGLISDPLLVGVALATTAIGTLLPILREAEELDTKFGRCVMGAGAIGEFGPIILFSLIMASGGELARRSGLLLTFTFIALTCMVFVLRVRPPRVIEILSRTLYKTSQFPVRLSMLLLGCMVVMADTFGLNLLLGAFAAGALVGLVARGPQAETFRHKLDAIGFGFLIPIFFIASGTQIDVAALFASSDSPAASAGVPRPPARCAGCPGPLLPQRFERPGASGARAVLGDLLAAHCRHRRYRQGDGPDIAGECGRPGRRRHPFGPVLPPYCPIASGQGCACSDGGSQLRNAVTKLRPAPERNCSAQRDRQFVLLCTFVVLPVVVVVSLVVQSMAVDSAS